MRTTVEESLTDDGDESGGRIWSASLVHHPNAELVGATTALSDDEPFLLGRATDAFGLNALDDSRLSRDHARIALEASRDPVIEDAGSTNRTYVNGEPVTRASLREGDVVGIGPFLVLVHRSVPQPDTGAAVTDEATELVGASAEHASLLRDIETSAAHTGHVVIFGEPGVGKTAVGRAIHAASRRSGGLQIVDCRVDLGAGMENHLFGHTREAFPGASDDRRGILEAAHRGTLLLDAVADASDKLQKALEHFLDSGEVQRIGSADRHHVDARVLATTTAPVHELVAHETLRTQFAHRLARTTIRVPPLRERLVDVPILAAHFAKRHSGEPRPLHRKLALALLLHPWFGNARELEGVIEAAVLESDDAPLRLTPRLSQLLAAGRKSRVARTLEADEPADTPPRTVIDEAGTWFQNDGQERVRLDRRPHLALILAGLAKNRRQDPAAPLSVTELVSLGWPGERVREPAGSNRVYVAITSLRKLGLAEVIRRSKYGYWIDPDASVEVVGGRDP